MSLTERIEVKQNQNFTLGTTIGTPPSDTTSIMQMYLIFSLNVKQRITKLQSQTHYSFAEQAINWPPPFPVAPSS